MKNKNKILNRLNERLEIILDEQSRLLEKLQSKINNTKAKTPNPQN